MNSLAMTTEWVQALVWVMILSKQHELKGLISVLHSRDKFSEADKGSESYIAGKAGISYEWHILENLSLKEDADCLV